MRLTVAQALVRFLANQYSERDGVEQRLIPGVFGIFGHGNVAGVGQALLEQQRPEMPYHLARNEQGMVHAAVGFARMRNRLQVMACTASIGPGSTNMLTGAALATTNRIPVLLLPSDVFATRVASPVLQELERPDTGDVSVNDAFRPLSVFFDRVWRPEQLPSALLGAMRVLTDPADTGAVTIALPQDVQAEAYDWPEELFAKRVWHIARPVPEPAALARAVALIRGAHGAAARRRRRACTTARPPRRCAGSPRPPASRSPTPRPARARCCGTTRRPSAGSGPPAPRSPTRWPATPTSSSASAPGTATSPPPRAPRSRTRTCGSSTSTSPPSTRPSTPARCSSPTRGRPSTR